MLVAEGCGEVACAVFNERLSLWVGHVDVVGVASAEGCEGVIGGKALEHRDAVDVNAVLAEGGGERSKRDGREADGDES